jgi:uncharacterized protein (DUF1778 family)
MSRTGRPKLPDEKRRSCIVQFRVSPEELELLMNAAEQDKQSASDWCRTTALGVAEVRRDAAYETRETP